jgi:uncharacterized protein (DUF1786 family)
MGKANMGLTGGTLSGAILAVDVGGGTQDLFLWEPGQAVENAVKLVLPAPTQILARRFARLTSAGQPVFLNGRVMGGGAIGRALRLHLACGLPVYATPQAALTFSDRLEQVQDWGLVLTETPPPEAAVLTLGDVDLETLNHCLAAFEVPAPKHFAVAAGVRGALLDPQAREHQDSGLMVVNLGNAHTFAALVRGERLWGIYEHHTGLLDPEKLFDHLRRFQAGELTNDEVFADWGHGCAYAPDYAPANPFIFTVITGPRRRLARDWPGVFAAPLGDMMLTGCFGLMAAFLEKEEVHAPWSEDFVHPETRR